MAADLSQFNEQQEIQKACQIVHDRMVADGYTPAEIDENMGIMQQFAKIAAESMIRQRGGIPIPNTDQQVPYSLPMAEQTMHLFTEGMAHTFAKCREFQVAGSLKIQFMQNVALEVFNQVDKVVAATIDQESLPSSAQLSLDHQQMLVYQTVESWLLHLVNEYEKQHGPIAPPPVAMPAPEVPADLPVAPLEPVATPAAAPPPRAKPSGPSPHDKYAAVALLLETMSAARQGKILSSFTAEEKELIGYYKNVENIEAKLDLGCVETQLRHFSQMLQAGRPGLKTQASESIRKLISVISGEKLLTCVVRERPLIRKYMTDMVAEVQGPGVSGLDVGQMSEQMPEQLTDYLSNLSPRMEEILYRHLNRQFKPEKAEASGPR